MGVGPEQNFTYIAALSPRMAFIVDIRRGNLHEHLLYKALFEMSPTAPISCRACSRGSVRPGSTASSSAASCSTPSIGAPAEAAVRSRTSRRCWTG